MTTAELIVANVEKVRLQIIAACERSGRNPDDVTLIAVSKKHPPSLIHAAWAAGVQHFGENRVEEAETKIPVANELVSQPVTWHMIGHIQSRKARYIPRLFQMVHSVDSLKLAQKLSDYAQAVDIKLPVLIQMNIAGEEQKSGFWAKGWQVDETVYQQLVNVISQINQLPSLVVQGLMTMAPIVSSPEQARPVFTSLATLRMRLEQSLELSLPHLSMGMTDDYPVAIEEGATLVRIGRAIFGPRT
ncbi:MAG: YggS family pyridoxal phosphate-dependent enzyme [Chloroflexi bacterium]|nr:MAG: YggS family pyridoxal phosphate-dependent enzyme [Chloroflexota bacterium]